MFKPDNPLFNALGKLADLIIINLLMIICCIPIITIGASVTAMYYVLVKMVKDEESYVAKDFFKSFKLNFFQATIIWVFNLLALVALTADVIIIKRGSANISEYMTAALIVIAVFVIAIMLYIYPILSHFENSIKNTFKNSVLLAISNLPYTLMFLVVTAIPVALLFTEIAFKILPIYILIGITGPAYICCFGWKKIFAKIEPSNDPEDSDEKADIEAEYTIGESNGKKEEEKTESE